MEIADVLKIIELHKKYLKIKLKNMEVDDVEIVILDNTGNEYNNSTFPLLLTTLKVAFENANKKDLKRYGRIPLGDAYRLKRDRGKPYQVATVSASTIRKETQKMYKDKIYIYPENAIIACIKFVNNHTDYNINMRDSIELIGKELAIQYGRIFHRDYNEFISDEKMTLVGKGNTNIRDSRNHPVNKIIINTDLNMFSKAYADETREIVYRGYLENKLLKKNG